MTRLVAIEASGRFSSLFVRHRAGRNAPLDWMSEAISGARLFGPKETGFTVFAWICGTSCLFWCLAPVAGLCVLLAC